MKISLILCTYNRERYLPAVLDSIVKQTISPSEYEVLLINNNSPGNTKTIAEKFKSDYPEINFLYFDEMNQGLSFARNRGIKESNCDLITFIDDDAFLTENYLETVIDAFKNRPDISALGGKILLSYEGIIPAWENKYLISLLGYFNLGDQPFSFDQRNYPRGSNMVFRKKIFDKIGHFNVSLGRIGTTMIGGEEKDIFERIYRLEKNTVLYLPSAVVYHTVPESRTTKEFIKSQAIGTGKSEKIRTKNRSQIIYLGRLFVEFLKWLASLLLALNYLLKNQKEKSKMLIYFRYWCTIGLLRD